MLNNDYIIDSCLKRRLPNKTTECDLVAPY